MRRLTTPILLVLGMLLLGWGLAYGQSAFTKVKSKPVNIKFGGQLVAVADENNSTLRLIPGTDFWVCVPVSTETISCVPAERVTGWLADSGEKSQ